MGETERLAELDDRFVDAYEAARQRLVDAQKARALIILHEDEMVFYHGDRAPRTFTGLRPPIYGTLKVFGHIPLAVFCLLTGWGPHGETLPHAALDGIRDYRGELANATHGLAALAAPASQPGNAALHTSLAIPGYTLAFLDRVIAGGRVAPDDLANYCRTSLADLNTSLLAATRVQIDACHARMMDLKENVLSADEWADLRVVILGPHMAHRDNSHLQYFSRLLHTPMYADRRVVYFEGDDNVGALDLLGATMLDFGIAQTMLDDPMRLHRDLLADATTTYLDELLGD